MDAGAGCRAGAVRLVPRVAAMASTTIELDTSDGAHGALRIGTGARTERAVVVVQEAFGVNAHIESICDRLAAEGYRAVARTCSIAPAGGRRRTTTSRKVIPHFERLTDDAFVTDIEARSVPQRPRVRRRSIGTVGFCMGGRVTFLESLELSLGAAVGFYGGGIVEGAVPAVPALDRSSRRAENPVARSVRRPGQVDPGRPGRATAGRAGRRPGRDRGGPLRRCRTRVQLRCPGLLRTRRRC